MTLSASLITWAGGLAAAALLMGGMALREPEAPFRMSASRISNLDGYRVSDMRGVRVGEIASVETDREGRTRWINIALDDGGIARVASFRADLDVARRLVSVRLSEDLLKARAAASSPSV